MEDREDDARAELARAAAGLSRQETTLQHWQYMQACALTELYAGQPARALALIDAQLPVFRRAYLFRVRAVRAFTGYVRLAALLGALAAGDRRLRAEVMRQRARSDADDSTGSVSNLVDAELAVLDGDLDRAIAAYRAAAAGFDTADMALIASAARWRLGELL